MCTIYISDKAENALIEYLKKKGCIIKRIKSEGIVGENISCHPDIFMCKLGTEDEDDIFFGSLNRIGLNYPDDIPYNAACTGTYFIHNLNYTDPDLLLEAKKRDMTLIDVKQGYTKCSVVTVDNKSIITYDRGIAKACEPLDIDVLLIEPGNVRLDGFDTGFIGGTSGKLGDEIIFNGDLFLHPDFIRIKEFIESKGLKCKWFAGYPLTDIGSFITERR